MSYRWTTSQQVWSDGREPCKSISTDVAEQPSNPPWDTFSTRCATLAAPFCSRSLLASPRRVLAGRRLGRDSFRQLLPAGLAIPLLKRVRGDLPLDEQLSELAPLSLALERHARESNAASTSDKTPGVGRLDIPPGVLCGTGDPNPGYGGRTRAARASAIAGRQLRELAGRPSLLARSVHSSRPDLRRDSSQRHHWAWRGGSQAVWRLLKRKPRTMPSSEEVRVRRLGLRSTLRRRERLRERRCQTARAARRDSWSG